MSRHHARDEPDSRPDDEIGDALIAQLGARLHAAQLERHLRPRVFSPLGLEPDQSVWAVTNLHAVWERRGGGWAQTVNGTTAPELRPRFWKDIPAPLLIDASHGAQWHADGARFIPDQACPVCSPAARVAAAVAPLNIRRAVP